MVMVVDVALVASGRKVVVNVVEAEVGIAASSGVVASAGNPENNEFGLKNRKVEKLTRQSFLV